MSPEVSELLKRALALPVDEWAALAKTLLDSLDAVQEAWARKSHAESTTSKRAEL